MDHRSIAASPPRVTKQVEENVKEIVEIPVKLEQENVIDSTNDILETVLMENKLRSQRSPSNDRLRLYKSPSPSPIKKKKKERSLSPGTKEIRAYWAEKEEKKKRKKSKKSKERRLSVVDLDVFANQPTLPMIEIRRSPSESSVDSIEKLRSEM